MTTNQSNLAAFYAKCADQMEDHYDRPECEDDLADIQERLEEVLADHNVLELACGKGFWTQFYADFAESVVATDINPDMLVAAEGLELPDTVQWQQADAMDVQVEGSFDACFAGFWWSHVLRQDQDGVLKMLREKLGKDALLVLIDETYAEDSSTVIARTDLEGNTFQILTQPDGERCEILRNFPTDSTLRKRFANFAREIRIVRLEHYWMLTCRLK